MGIGWSVDANVFHDCILNLTCGKLKPNRVFLQTSYNTGVDRGRQPVGR